MSRSNRALVTTGVAVFATAYGLSVLTALGYVTSGGPHAEEYAGLLCPVGGPFITMGTADDVIAVMTFDGVMQVSGAVLTIVGLAMKEKKLLRDDVVSDASWKKPEVLAGSRSVGLRWRF